MADVKSKGCGGPYYKLSLASMIVFFMSSSSLGFQDTVFNIPADSIRGFLNDSYVSRYSDACPVVMLWSLAVGAYGVGLVLGSFIVVLVADRFGRKWSLLLGCGSVLIVGHATMALSKRSNLFELLIVGRFLAGLAGCPAQGLAVMWMIEASPPKYAGLIGSLANGFVPVGMLVAQLLALPELFGTDDLWPILLACGAVPSLVGLASAFWLPESPKYLALLRHNEKEAEPAVKFYYGPTVNVENTLLEFQHEHSADNGGKISMRDLLVSQRHRNPLLLSALTNALPTSLGWFAIGVYSTTVLKWFGMQDDAANGCTNAVMAVSVVTVLLAPVCIHRFPRRWLLLTTALFVALGHVIIFVTALFYKSTPSKYVAAAVFVFDGIAVNLGTAPIPLILAVELAPLETRSICTTLGMFSLNVGAFLSQTFFYSVFLSVESVAFLIFTLVSVPAIIYLYFALPETKDRQYDDFAKKWNAARSDQPIAL